ncbi:MAG: MATE family efflux transporter [Clostridia bacterium]|nr:MATE family efflux transporter [Clostridia bacterium]
MKNNKTKDMTSGSPVKLILGFSVPLLFGFLFQQFYNLADTVIVGRVLGVNALASVGATGSVNFLIIGFCMGVCGGFGIPIAQKFGAKDDAGLRKFVANSIYLSTVLAVVMTVIVVIFCRPILLLMQTPADIIDDSYRYIVVIFIGIPVTYLVNLLMSYVRALGDSKTPVIFLTIAAVLNIILDLLFMIVFHMGVQGAAVATVLAQLIVGVCGLFYIIKHFPILRLGKADWELSMHHIKILCSMGIPMGLQYSITAIGSVILQTAVNSLGSVSVASITAGSKISMFFCCPFDALGTTMATYGGQNVGANKLDRVDRGLKSCCLLGIIYSVLAFGVIWLFGRDIAQLFVEAKETIILNEVDQFLFLNSMFYIPLAFVNIVRFMIQGLGFSKFAIIAGVCEMIARSIVGFLFVPVYGFTAACLANPLAWVAADIFLIPAYLSVIKKLRAIFEKKTEAVKELQSV